MKRQSLFSGKKKKKKKSSTNLSSAEFSQKRVKVKVTFLTHGLDEKNLKQHDVQRKCRERL